LTTSTLEAPAFDNPGCLGRGAASGRISRTVTPPLSGGGEMPAQVPIGVRMLRVSADDAGTRLENPRNETTADDTG